MRVVIGSAALVLAAVTPSLQSVAAQATVTPPAMLSVTCETVKPGMGPAHDRHEERWARAVEAAKGFPSALAVQSATGPTVSCWMTAAEGYEALAKSNERLMGDPTYAAALPTLMQSDAAFLSDVRTYIATLRPDLSAGDMPNILTRRAMTWSEWRVRPGPGEGLFEGAVKAYRGAMTRAGLNPQFRVYQVRQGAPAATYWIFNSSSTMAKFDTEVANEPKVMSAFTPEDQRAFEEYFAKGHVSMLDNLWSYNAAQSQLTAEQRASDPFWKRKAPR